MERNTLKSNRRRLVCAECKFYTVEKFLKREIVSKTISWDVMKTNYLSSPFICFKYEISCVHLAKNNNNNKQKASKLWNQKLNVPLKSICWCKLQNQLWHVQSRLRRLSIFTSGMSGNLLQSLPADEAILALLTLFRKVNTRSTVIFPCWSPSRQSPLQPFFFFCAGPIWGRMGPTENEC